MYQNNNHQVVIILILALVLLASNDIKNMTVQQHQTGQYRQIEIQVIVRVLWRWNSDERESFLLLFIFVLLVVLVQKILQAMKKLIFTFLDLYPLFSSRVRYHLPMLTSPGG
jgi:hypothetical protein